MNEKKLSMISLICTLVLVLGGVIALAVFVLPKEYHGGGYFFSETTEATEPPLVPNNPFKAEDFAYQNGYITCSAAEYETGIDVSSFQGSIDWQRVAEDGFTFAMIRAGFRGYGKEGELYKDPRFEQNLDGAAQAGLKVGVYYFSQAKNVGEAEEEARYVLDILGGRQLDLPVVFDWEIPNDQARTIFVEGETVTDCANAFCDVVESAGYESMIYFNPDFADKYIIMDKLADRKFWLALYGDAMTFRKRVDMWQYSQSGTVNGIDHPVDIDMLFHY